jgi:hypothetical protein
LPQYVFVRNYLDNPFFAKRKKTFKEVKTAFPSKPEVNFTNILRSAFTYVNCAGSFLCLRFRFVLYWRKTVGAKAARRMLVKLTPGDNPMKDVLI